MHDNSPPICDYEDYDYQACFWGRGEREYEDAVEAIALRRLLPSTGRRLLEVGAGAGRNTPRYVGFQSVVLMDYSRAQLSQAKACLGASRCYVYVVADAYDLPFAPGVFDTATMIRTLHHMARPELVLRQVRHALTTGGIFILEYPNKRNLKAILRWLVRRQSWNPFDRHPVEFAPLHFDFHPAAIRSWLDQAGFAVRRQLSVSHFRLGFLKRWVPLRLLVALDALAQLSGDGFQLTPSVFVRGEAVE